MNCTSNKIRSGRGAVSSKRVDFHFAVSGHILMPACKFPVDLTAVSLDNSLPTLVALWATTDFGELYIRRSSIDGLKLRVCGREFSVNIARRSHGSRAILWLPAADVFCGVFGKASRS